MSTPGGDTGTVLRRALHLAELGRLDTAESLTRQVLADEPRNAAALRVLAYCHLQAGRYAEMLAAADESAAITPDEPAAHRMRARALIGLRRGAAARAAAERGRSLDPQNHNSELVLAGALLAAGGTRAVLAAADAVARAHRLAPESAGVYVTEGHVQHRLARFGRARAAFTQALRLEPENLSALHGLGRLDSFRGRLTRASSALGGSLSMAPDDPAVLKSARDAASRTLWLLTDAGCLVLVVFLLLSNIPRSALGGPAAVAGTLAVTLAGVVAAAGLVGWRLTRLSAASRTLLRASRWRFTFVVAWLRMVFLAVASVILAFGAQPTRSPAALQTVAYVLLTVSLVLLGLRIRSWLVWELAMLIVRSWFWAAQAVFAALSYGRRAYGGSVARAGPGSVAGPESGSPVGSSQRPAGG